MELKFNKKRPVRRLLLLAMALIMLTLICLAWLLYQYTYVGYVRGDMRQNVELLIEQTNKALESSFSLMENGINYFFNDSILHEWTEMESEEAGRRLIAKLNLDQALRQSLMVNSAWENDLMGAAFLFVDQYTFSFYCKGDLPLSRMTRQSATISKRLREQRVQDLVVMPPLEKERAFFIVKSYIEEGRPNKNLQLLVAVNEKVLREEYESLLSFEGAEAFITDQNGVIYSAQDASMLGEAPALPDGVSLTDGELLSIEVNDEICFFSTKQVSSTGLWLVCKIPQRSYAAAMIRAMRQYIVLMCIALAAFFAIAMVFVYKGTAFLEDVKHSFAEMRNGHYNVRLPPFSTAELSELSEAFNSMAEQINYLIHEVYEYQIEAKNAELNYLQAQINPHFLFNTLATIGTLAKLNRQEEIYRISNAMSILLQASFKADQKDMIPVSEELEYVQCYLFIQRQRFGDKLTYQIILEEESLQHCLIPRLCVEPIVENAVIHGLEPKLDSGEVTIRVAREARDLIICVSDDGVGISQAFELGRELEPSHGKASIGMLNVHRRLQLAYGEVYGIRIDRDVHKGARVVIRLPYRTGGSADV